jgi:hypothetical protein
LVGGVKARAFEMGRRGCPYAVECSSAFIHRTAILHRHIVDAAEDVEDIPAGWTFIFIFHSGIA